MQDTLCGEETKGRIKKSQGHGRQSACPCPLSIISYPHTQKRLLSPTTEGLEAQMIHAALQRAICCPPSPSYFKNPVIVFTLIFFLKLPAYSLVALECYISNVNSFYYRSPQLSPSSYMPLAFQSNIFGLWSLCYGALWCSATWHSAQYSNSYCS